MLKDIQKWKSALLWSSQTIKKATNQFKHMKKVK